MELEAAQIEAYLEDTNGQHVEIKQIGVLGQKDTGSAALKAFGYGHPIYVDYQTNGSNPNRIVLRQVNRNGFGREMDSDRAAAIWLDFHAFNHLPAHIRAHDMVAVDVAGRLASIGQTEELLLVTEYATGQPYARDLMRIRDNGYMEEEDCARARALATYLAHIHTQKHTDPLLWRRRIRDLVGHGEGIMGLTDSYPADFPLISPADLCAIEQRAIEWRWRLKPLTHRLSQVHGDFHPFNVIFRTDTFFTLIDRSRGPWGEPADDVSCMTINYLFFSLQRYGRLDGPFQDLYLAFWETYLRQTEDRGFPAVIQPWYAWRALVLASPQWYNVTDEVRLKLLAFARNVLASPHFEWRTINRYLHDA
ncbi:MAG: phosphotransferase [Ardenticatenales bacterium]|nr:phosphotransferase [Ardenticatenales bacterium]